MKNIYIFLLNLLYWWDIHSYLKTLVCSFSMNIFVVAIKSRIRDPLCINLCSETLLSCQSQVNSNYGGKKQLKRSNYKTCLNSRGSSTLSPLLLFHQDENSNDGIRGSQTTC